MSNGSTCSAIYANATALCLYANTPAVQNCLADDEASGILGDYLIFWRCTAEEASHCVLSWRQAVSIR